jgi:transposase
MRIVLSAAEGVSNNELARQLSTTPTTILKWRQRFRTHKHPAVKAWLAARPNYNLHFTPTSSSWLNLVERFFAKITQRRIRRGTFSTVPALINAITEYIRDRNKKPKPFTLVASADQIVRKVRRCLAISEAAHHRGSASDR